MKKNTQYTLEIPFPENVRLEKKNDILLFQGPLGSTGIHFHKIDGLSQAAYSINQENGIYSLTCLTPSRAHHGLLKKLFLNKVHGITQGFLLYLKITGIGYRASIQKNTVILKLGYSHDIIYNIPLSVRIFLLDPTTLCIFGLDKNQVTQIASKLRHLRKPSVYKGKGIRLLHEKIPLKTGKRK